MIRKLGGLFSLLSVALLFFIALFTYRDIGNEEVSINLVQVAISILIGGFLLTIIYLYKAWHSDIQKYMPTVLIILGIAIQVILVVRLEMPFMTDVGYVFTQAERLTDNNQNWLHYFYIYPNNVNIAILWSAIFKVFNFLGISNHVLAAKLLQVLLLDVSVYFMSKSLKDVFPRFYKWIMIGMIFYLPFTMMALFLYSDTFALVIFNLLITCMAKVLKVNYSLRKDFWWFILTAVILGLGVALRSNLGIVGIAVGITILIAKEFKWKDKGIFLIAILVGMVVVSGLFNGIAVNKGYEKNPEEVTPSVRYVNMSWNPNTDGQIDGADAWAWSELPKDERSEKLTEELKNRISNYSVLGLGKHIVRKLSFMYATGFVHQDFGNLYEKGHLPIWQSIQKFSRLIFQPIYVLLLLGSIITILKAMKSSKQIESLVLFLGISFLGTIMFHGLLWEVRDRYAIITLPAMIVLGLIGLHECTDWAIKTKLPIKKRTLVFTGFIVGALGVTVASLVASPITPRETIMSKGYYMYAGGNEKNGETFQLTRNSTYKVRIHLNHQAKTFNYTLGWVDAKAAKKINIKLIKISNDKVYKGTTKQNFNAINAKFEPGDYELITKTGNISPTETYLFANAETSAFQTETVRKNNRVLDGVIPFYQFIN